MTELSIHELSLGFSHDRQMLVEFLAKHHLNYEDDIEAAFGVFDSDDNLTATLAELDQISTKYHVNFVLSVSMDGEELPESAKDMVLVAL